jgi:hypothetical protein
MEAMIKEGLMTIFLSRVISLVLFAGLGIGLARRQTAPHSKGMWIMLVLGLVLAEFIGGDTKLIAYGDAGIYLNQALQGLFAGLLIGHLSRQRTEAASIQ